MKFEYEEDIYDDGVVALIWENILGTEFLVWWSDGGPFWVSGDGDVAFAQSTWGQLLAEATKKFYKGDSVTITF